MKFNWMDAAKVILALVATGFAWSAENQEGAISLAAMIAVWLLGLAFKRKGWKVGKLHLTIALFVVSVGLAILFQPVVLPALPAWEGDVVLFVSAILVWLGAFIDLGGQIVLWATGIYNILLAKVLEKLEYTPAILRLTNRPPFEGVG